MQLKPRTYTSEAADVTFDGKRCIHAQECVNRLSQVFDVDKRPWIQPEQATPDQLLEVIQRCPSGALHLERKDGGPTEVADAQATVTIEPDGPLYVRGQLTIKNNDGETLLEDVRVAMCRCGQSNNKPLCDNSHIAAGFADMGMPEVRSTEGELGAAVTLTPATDGPLLLQAETNFAILNAKGETIFVGNETALCRCGGSQNKPFCDGTHHLIGFKAE